MTTVDTARVTDVEMPASPVRVWSTIQAAKSGGAK